MTPFFVYGLCCSLIFSFDNANTFTHHHHPITATTTATYTFIYQHHQKTTTTRCKLPERKFGFSTSGSMEKQHRHSIYSTAYKKVNVRSLFDSYGYKCATRYDKGVLQIQVQALCRPYCPTKAEAKWQYSFSEMIQNE